MSVSDQLTAMIFELRSAGSPLAKAKAIARAWRMVRRLSPGDRRILAEEAGFDGAEELLESLAAKSGGVAPAMMMQLLNGLREKSTDGISDLVVGLKNPESREEILMRGADAVAQAISSGSVEDEETADTEQNLAEQEIEAFEAPIPPLPEKDVPAERPEASALEWTETDDLDETDGPEVESATAGSEAQIMKIVETPLPELDDSPTIEEDRSGEIGPIDIESVVEAIESEASLVVRLLLLREAIPILEIATSSGLSRLVEVFPEGWARRRALIAIIESYEAIDVSDALDLIERLEKPGDRRWCLAVLADRGGLRNLEVERALTMIKSPVLRRRFRRVSGEAL